MPDLPDLWDNFIMSLNHVTKLDMDFVIAITYIGGIEEEAFGGFHSSFGISGIGVKGRERQIKE